MGERKMSENTHQFKARYVNERIVNLYKPKPVFAIQTHTLSAEQNFKISEDKIKTIYQQRIQ
jgi:hypothetical protein